MSIMAKTPSGYKKIGSAYLGERPVDKVFNANGDVVYALQRELTGVPPLLFKGKEQSELLNYRICGNTETKQRDYSGSSPLTVPVHGGELYNYRIYGNTANGESVGERTANLWDGIFLQGCWLSSDGSFQASSKWICTQKMPCKANTDYTFTFDIKSRWYGFAWYDIDGNYIESNGSTIERQSNIFTAISPANAAFMAVNIAGDHIGTAPLDIHPSDVTDFMLVEGSTALPYEPYGYKVPIAVTNSGTTSNETIYLPKPIKMVGSETEYVDFYSQKQYFADGTNTAVTIPALPISTGTNTVTVNTTVQPSSVEVSIDEHVSVGDLVTSGQHAGEYVVPVTVEGKNLWDGIFLQGYWAYADGSYGKYPTWICTTKIPCTGGQMYTYSFSKASRWFGFVWYDGDGNYISTNNLQNDSDVHYRSYSATSPANAAYMIVNIAGYPSANATIFPADVTDFMLVAGEYTSETMPNYEPYHAPVTTPIYLPEPIKMVGDEAEYIDYAEQKQHFADGTSVDVTLPALPTLSGTNTMSIDTEVQPSRMDIKGRIKSLT